MASPPGRITILGNLRGRSVVVVHTVFARARSLERIELDSSPAPRSRCSSSCPSSSSLPPSPRPSPPPCPSRRSSGSTSPTSSRAPPHLRSSIPPSATTTPHAPSSSLAVNPPAASRPPRLSCPCISLLFLPQAHLLLASIATATHGPFPTPRQICPRLPLPPDSWPSVAMTSPPASPSPAPLPLTPSHPPLQSPCPSSPRRKGHR